MRMLWFRWYYVLGLILSFGVLLFAFFLEYHQGIMPCALCQLQRFMFLLLGIGFLIAIIRRLSCRLVYTVAWLNSLWCIFGLYFALRQLWLIHHFQPGAGICGGGIVLLLSNLAFTDALKSAFLGTGDCAHVTWTWLSITLPGWSGINYIVLFILSWVPVWSHKRRHSSHDTTQN